MPRSLSTYCYKITPYEIIKLSHMSLRVGNHHTLEFPSQFEIISDDHYFCAKNFRGSNEL